MSVGASRLSDIERAPDGGSRYRLRDLFTPLDTLLVSGGDGRLALDPKERVNGYGCAPSPESEIWNFASSTASTISRPGYDRAAMAREELVHKSLFDEVEIAFDRRCEDMREELRGHFQLPPRVDIVLSPSGTDSQLHALFLAHAVLGAPPVTIVVGADQTGSGTIHTARGHHFSAMMASGVAVRKDGAIAGLAGDSIAVPLLDAAGFAMRGDADAAVVRTIEDSLAQGRRVLLHIMDSSKLGWRAPSAACLDEIARRWPRKVQVVVDACQARLGRRRLRSYLDRGYMVLITGSKFFGGPAFSGALLVPKGISRALDRIEGIAPGFFDYAGRCDWPMAWTALRSRFERRPNFGQWLRWEAALADIGNYYAVPGAFRGKAMAELAAGVDSMIALSPSLRAVPAALGAADADDEEFTQPSIFPFTLMRNSKPVSVADTSAVHRALARDMSDGIVGSAADRQVAAQRCLIGQPVRLEQADAAPQAALRLCVGARLVTEAWSVDSAQAQANVQDILDRIAHVLVKIELLLDRTAAVPA
ncbi:hypothetical protein [Bradyrhizobium guangdongense]|uniref:Bll5850 protein n=1 Tax=Bradyrhizobium guangdongense TaxID=1325090 RepID=A0A410VGC1_9BRAD|nr:hypothetical protein [Bradyrhizobium guangdongense]QAU42701.1 hypothetical protein X265_14445 [Bradyrhizobium guangdongense]QOZ59795.1 hypothetical protein XH86_14450 [Bradyrhizobium guangdongense]GGI29465.1 hypothetical protein GCM10010987_54560 [Bradyrhizobium guangdongense]